MSRYVARGVEYQVQANAIHAVLQLKSNLIWHVHLQLLGQSLRANVPIVPLLKDCPVLASNDKIHVPKSSGGNGPCTAVACALCSVS